MLSRHALTLAPLSQWVGQLVAGVALVGCQTAPGRAANLDQARQQFSEQAFCPLSRVTVGRGDVRPAPPPRVAADPERLAMWREAFDRSEQGEARQTIAAAGCGEQITYACWQWPAPQTSGRHARRGQRTQDVVIGASCNEIPGGAQPSSLP